MRKIYFIITAILLLSIFLVFQIQLRPRIKERIVTQKLEDISIITTGEDVYREIIYTKTTEDLFWMPIKNKEILFSVDYRITTGIDLQKGYKVKNHGLYTEIVLPPCEVLSIDADDLSIKEYFSKERFSKINRDDYFSIINQTKNDLKNSDALKDLLRNSEINAKKTINTLYKIGGENVKISFSNMVIKE